MKLTKPIIALSAALFVSLLANLFMGGLLLGHRMGQEKPSPRAEMKARTKELRQRLSDKDEAVLKESMRDNQKKFEEMRKDLEDIRQDIQAATHAMPFNQETLDEALKEEKQKKMEILRLMQEARKEVMEKLSPEGVQILQHMAPPPRFSVRRSVMPAGTGDEPILWEETEE